MRLMPGRCLVVLSFFFCLIACVGSSLRAQTQTWTPTTYSGIDIPAGSVVQASDGNIYGIDSSSAETTYTIIYKVRPSGSVSTFFSTPNTSFTSLLQGTDGNLYGLQTEGEYLSGAIFRLTLSGSYSLVYSFPSGDGPTSAFIQGTDGNFYGLQGSPPNPALYRVSPQGAHSLVYVFQSTQAPTFNTLLQGADGNFYGNTQTQFFRLTPAGSYTALHTWPSGGYAPGSLIQGADGAFYGVADVATATSNGNTFESYVYRITSSGATTLVTQ